MADRYRASPLSVHLSQKDRAWLVKRARDEDVSVPALIKLAVQHFRYWQEGGEEALSEALEIFEAERRGQEDERRRRLYFQREYGVQSRRLHDMLRDERHLRWEQEKQLRDERNLRFEYENQLRDERNLRRQSPRLHDVLRDERHRRWAQEEQQRDERKLRAEYENQLRDERKLHAERENQLRDERKLHAERENQLRDERDHYERQAKAAEPYGPTVAKLLALAIRSGSDAEAMAAFAKARALHRHEQ
jgi:hypothetical protein